MKKLALLASCGFMISMGCARKERLKPVDTEKLSQKERKGYPDWILNPYVDGFDPSNSICASAQSTMGLSSGNISAASDDARIVIKAVGSDYEEVTDRDELGVFLPQVKFVKAYASTRSKQNWTIELSSGDEIVKMGMSIRSNKPGHAGKRKLGQFPTGLAIKYNGIEK